MAATNKRALAKVAKVPTSRSGSSKAIEEHIEHGLVARIFRDLRPNERGDKNKNKKNTEYGKPYHFYLFDGNKKARHLTQQQVIELYALPGITIADEILDFTDAIVEHVNELLADWVTNRATWQAQLSEQTEAQKSPKAVDVEQTQQALAAKIAGNGKRTLASVND